MSKVVRNLAGPPDDLESWADALDLEGMEREEFLESGYLMRTPPFVRERYVAMRKNGRLT